MSGGFVKIYGTILTSSVWMESAATRLVWITMLAAAEQHGIVSASVPGLAHLARVSLSECEEALRVLTSPDPYSKNEANDGRRIEKVEGGWSVLNYDTYREYRTDQQLGAAERKRRQRERDLSRDERDTSRDISQKSEVRSQKSEEEIKTSKDDRYKQFADKVDRRQFDRFAGQHPLPRPFTPESVRRFLDDLESDGIPFDFVLADVLWQLIQAKKPVRSLHYFREGILTRWGEAQKRPAARNGSPESVVSILSRGARESRSVVREGSAETDESPSSGSEATAEEKARTPETSAVQGWPICWLLGLGTMGEGEG